MQDPPRELRNQITAIEVVDLAKVSPCPGGCGTLVRRFASVPIRGQGLDGDPSGPWWCSACLQAKVVEALTRGDAPGVD